MKIVLATLHSRYSHASLALPSLAAACGRLTGATCVILESTVHDHPDRLLRSLVAGEGDIYAFSCYLWNIRQTLGLIADLKQVRPGAFAVLGGPEVSFGAFELMTANEAVDCIVRGEGEQTFAELVELVAACGGSPPPELLEEVAGITFRSDDGIVATSDRHPVFRLDDLPSPFRAGFVDLAKPLVYCETSRGCPFSCAFCMSSLDEGVRTYSPERIRGDLDLLMEREVSTIKFVDRTFNYNAGRADRIWAHIVRNNRSSRFHFEIAADLLTEANFATLRTVPPGMFRFEIGVQSGDRETLARVGRRSDLEALFANARRLRRETGVIVHLDLVAGLPGEGYGGFLGSLGRLLDARPHHIQVETLKVLKGAPMRRIAVEEGYAFSAAPPYRVLRTPQLSFEEIGRIEDVARLLDLIANSGRFPVFLDAVAQEMPLAEFFDRLARFRDQAGDGEPSGVRELCDLLARFVASCCRDRTLLDDALSYDYCRSGYPSPGCLPLCFGENTGAREQRGGTGGALPGEAPLPAGARVRRFRRRFLRNYLAAPCGGEPAEVRFTYVSVEGKGERVIATLVGE